MFHLHRAERTDALADALADILAEPLADPMTAEIVSVPAPGVERWLQQRLATRLGTSGHADGVAANIDFASPAALTDRVLTDAAGRTGSAAPADLWRPTAMTWPVLRVLDDMIDDPRLAILARHVGAGADGDDHRRGRRYATARQIAGLFDSYARQRPTILSEWVAGHDTDGVGEHVPGDLSWQPDFWRAVRRDIGVPHPVESLSEMCATLRNDPTVTDLPERLSVFGPTRMTESVRSVLSALAVHRAVHVFLPHPSPALWSAVREASSGALRVRRSDRQLPIPAHPLVATLSRDVQELQERIEPLADTIDHHGPVGGGASGSPTVLSELQAGIRDDRSQRQGEDLVGDDGSVEIHACHGPERQVEVLRDRLLHLFSDDPTLEPRDVLVMCPNVETFAPLIRGAFGQAGLDHPAQHLRVRLADRGLRHTNEVLDVMAAVVELSTGRVTTGAVLDILSRPSVRHRFTVDDDEFEVVREWLANSNVRWAIDDRQRRRFGLDGFGQGTFEAGLDRIALGAVAEEADDEWLGTALPLAGVESTEIDLAGRFAEFVARLSWALDALSGAHPPRVWVDILVQIVDGLVAAAPGDEWQHAQAIRAITEVFDDGADGADDGSRAVDLRLGDVRDLLTILVAAAPTRANFRTGELTVCSMVPMRSVPHRVVALLGVDGDAFPRTVRIDGDDLLGRSPLVGERNPRDEDRQLFLDAICAATDRLMILYTGADPVSGQRVPPAVVVSELADAVRLVTGTDIERRHTLHAFDVANFEPDAVAGVSGPLSYDTALLTGARALLREPAARSVPADVRLDAPACDDIDLDSLIAFLLQPVEGFFRQRLGVRLPDERRPHDDQLDIDLDALDAWAIGDRFLSAMLAGADLAECQAAELRRGTLPPFALGTEKLRDISAGVEAVFAVADAARRGERESVDVVVPLADGRRLYGTVADIFGQTMVTANYSQLSPRHRMQSWIRLLALAAAHQTGQLSSSPIAEALVVARRSGGATAAPSATRSALRVPDDPLAVLTDLIAVRDSGLRRVIPLMTKTAAAFAEKYARNDNIDAALREARYRFDNKFGDHTDRYLRLAHTGEVDQPVDFETFAAESLTTGQWGGLNLPGQSGEPVFAALTRLTWVPLVRHEDRS